MSGFSYQTAFSRNIGWVTREEQALPRRRCVATAGLVELHLSKLCRLGIGQFHLADFGTFDSANCKRSSINHGLSVLRRSRSGQCPKNLPGSRSSPGSARGLPLRYLLQQADPMLGNQSLAAFVLVLARLQLVTLPPRGS